jgi:mycothiol synthase
MLEIMIAPCNPSQRKNTMTTPLLATPTRTLPEGYSLRATTLDDAEAVAEFFRATSLQRDDDETFSPELLRNDWVAPNFDLALSSRLVIAPDGSIVGAITVFDSAEVPVSVYSNWDVLHTDPHAHAIGLCLLEWGENRSRQAIDRCPPEARVSMKAGTKQGYAPDEAILNEFGMTPSRYFNRMLINMTEPPIAPALPAGYSLTSYAVRNDLRDLVIAKDDIWRDHYGYVEQSIESIMEDWQHWLSTDKKLSLDMWYLALDDATNEIVGMVLCRDEEWDDPKAGYVAIVGVRRAHRKQGIAEILLRKSFAEFWKRGRKDVSLFVDGSNPTGATRLYARAGMHLSRTYTQYQKELRAGIELTNTAKAE